MDLHSSGLPNEDLTARLNDLLDKISLEQKLNNRLDEAIRNGEISIQIIPELEQKIIKYLEVVQRISKYVGDVYEIIQINNSDNSQSPK